MVDAPHCRVHPQNEIPYPGLGCFVCRIQIEANKRFFMKRFTWSRIAMVVIPILIVVLLAFWR